MAVLYISGRWDQDTIHLPASSLVVVFSIQSACSTVPVQVVLVEEEDMDRTSVINLCNKTRKASESAIDKSRGIKKYEMDNLERNISKLTLFTHSQNSPKSISQALASNHLFTVSKDALSFLISRKHSIPHVVQSCVLPAVFCESDHWCIVGMCASLRYILQLAEVENNDIFAKKLLGFRGGCLQACAEVSCWTKFCEIEMPHLLEEMFSSEQTIINDFVIPRELLRYNNHMSRPPILHNALKMKQEFIKKTVKNKKERNLLLSKKLNELPELDHDFAEGLEITLADVMLFVCFDLIMFKLSALKLHSFAPLVLKWQKLIISKEAVNNAMPLLDEIKSKYGVSETLSNCNLIIPKVLEESLYKSDPERLKLHCIGSMTLQRDIDHVLERLTSVDIEVRYSQPCHNSITLPWETYPTAVHPQEGSLPHTRLLRKCQQLENIVSEVVVISKPGDCIVDFCAGGGHVGIVLAYCLPQCTVILIENKARSLLRAKTRVNALDLNNVLFFQCNLDYFFGNFDIGVCLHACGQATDLVLQKCYVKKAAFVCSPCCYGSIQPNHSVEYPRSKIYRSALPRLSDYLTLCHSADQTHAPEHPSTAQGQLCMRLIDDDRLEHARHLGYNTKLMIMTPVTCSPKNHMLVGTLKHECQT